MMFMASANDLLSLFVTLEFATFGFLRARSYLRDDMASNEAGLKFFILGVFAAGLLGYGISLVYGETGKLVFSEMTGANRPPAWSSDSSSFCRPGVQDRRRSLPFLDSGHLSRCPDSVTAFLSIAPKVAAFAILLRLFLVALATFKPAWALLIVAASISP